MNSPISFFTALGSGGMHLIWWNIYSPCLLRSLSLGPQIFSSLEGLGFGNKAKISKSIQPLPLWRWLGRWMGVGGGGRGE